MVWRVFFLLKNEKLSLYFFFFSPHTLLLRYNVTIAEGTDDGAQGLQRMRLSARGVAPVGMSARRGTASVFHRPRDGYARGCASFLQTNSQIEPRSIGALFVY